MRTKGVAASCLAAAIVMLSASVLRAQTPPPGAEAAPPAQAAPETPGVLNSINSFFERGAKNIRTDLERAKERMDNLNDTAAADRKDFNTKASEAGKNAADATKQAVDSVVKLPTARMIDGRERCALAPNGAPDCLSAAETLCRKKGFVTGKSMDFTSAEECPARAYLSGRQEPEACTTVTFISRAMCQ